MRVAVFLSIVTVTALITLAVMYGGSLWARWTARRVRKRTRKLYSDERRAARALERHIIEIEQTLDLDHDAPFLSLDTRTRAVETVADYRNRHPKET